LSDGSQDSLVNVLPQFVAAHATTLYAFFSESVLAVDPTVFVIASDERDPRWISHFERKQRANSFEAACSAVHEVPDEHVLAQRDVPGAVVWRT